MDGTNIELTKMDHPIEKHINVIQELLSAKNKANLTKTTFGFVVVYNVLQYPIVKAPMESKFVRVHLHSHSPLSLRN